jgi:magnesium-transporting ATPase (P-type)
MLISLTCSICRGVGVYKMRKIKAAIKNFPSIAALGQVKDLFVDKTGTMTEGKIGVREVWESRRKYKVAGRADADPIGRGGFSVDGVPVRQISGTLQVLLFAHLLLFSCLCIAASFGKWDDLQ